MFGPTTPAEFGAGHGDSLRGSGRKHVAEAGNNEAEAYCGAPVDVGAYESAEQQAQREVTHRFGERACADLDADREADPARSNCVGTTALCPGPTSWLCAIRETVWPTTTTLTPQDNDPRCARCSGRVGR